MSLFFGPVPICIDIHEHYIKQTFRNRCRIVTAQGTAELTVPVIKPGRRAAKDVEIDNSQPWQRTHWRAFTSAYARSPFFEYYAPYFEDLYQHKNFDKLTDLTAELLQLCLRLLKADNKPKYTTDYQKDGDFLDLRNIILPKKPLTELPFCQSVAYTQVFGGKFVPNVSILDLLFCEGPQAGSTLKHMFTGFYYLP